MPFTIPTTSKFQLTCRRLISLLKNKKKSTTKRFFCNISYFNAKNSNLWWSDCGFSANILNKDIIVIVHLTDDKAKAILFLTI